MSAVQLNTQPNTFYQKVEVQLTFCDRVTKFALAFLATLPLFIGLCFKSIRDSWMEIWTGKTIAFKEVTIPQPAVAIAPPKVVIPTPPPEHATIPLVETPPSEEGVTPRPNPLIKAIEYGNPLSVGGIVLAAMTFSTCAAISYLPHPFLIWSATIGSCFFAPVVASIIDSSLANGPIMESFAGVGLQAGIVSLLGLPITQIINGSQPTWLAWGLTSLAIGCVGKGYLAYMHFKEY